MKAKYCGRCWDWWAASRPEGAPPGAKEPLRGRPPRPSRSMPAPCAAGWRVLVGAPTAQAVPGERPQREPARQAGGTDAVRLALEAALARAEGAETRGPVLAAAAAKAREALEALEGACSLGALEDQIAAKGRVAAPAPPSGRTPLGGSRTPLKSCARTFTPQAPSLHTLPPEALEDLEGARAPGSPLLPLGFGLADRLPLHHQHLQLQPQWIRPGMLEQESPTAEVDVEV